jgi:hypothetical protein
VPARILAVVLAFGMLPGSVAGRSAPGQERAPSRLWVLQPPDTIVEYDVAAFGAKRTIKVPRRLLDHPEYLSISANGQMAFVPPAGTEWAEADPALPGNRAWIWDGQQAHAWPVEVSESGPQAAEAIPRTRTVRHWFLSTNGDSLFWFETTLEYRPEKAVADSGPQFSVRASARVWRTDLAGGRRRQVAAFPVGGWCRCGTGACEETCPEWELWAPDGTVGDFFLATRVTPGQLQTTWHESVRYLRSGSTWRSSPLPRAVEKLLGASARGDALIAAVLDGACCGWDNESSDQLLLLRDGKVIVLYDEFARYSNQNYDVSIFPSGARLAPGESLVAYTLVSTAPAGGEIRLASSGTPDSAALTRLRAALPGLPAVEILEPGSPSSPPAVIPRAGLVGWLTDRELLVAREGVLTVCDRVGNTGRATSIRVRSASDAFLR